MYVLMGTFLSNRIHNVVRKQNLEGERNLQETRALFT